MGNRKIIKNKYIENILEIFSRKKDIDIDKLKDIISDEKIDCDHEQFISKYILEIEEKLKDTEYSDNITISKTNIAKKTNKKYLNKLRSFAFSDKRIKQENLKYNIDDDFQRTTYLEESYTISIRKLNIQITSENIELIFNVAKLTPFNENFKYYSGLIPKIFIEIKNCEFILNKENVYINGFNIIIGDGANIELISNIFKASLRISISGSVAHTVSMKNNKFIGNILMIESKKHNEKKGLGIFDPNLNIYPLKFEGNDIPQLFIEGNTGVQFLGKNKIQELNIDQSISVRWNLYQNIQNSTKESIEKHLKLFLDLQKKAKKGGDQKQEKLFRMEIVKCNHAEINNESFMISFQERMIMNWSKIISNYGTSWLQPIICLAYLNFATAIILTEPTLIISTCHISQELENIYEKMLQLYIPIIWLIEIYNDGSNINTNNLIINILHKAIYAALIYEIVKAFRIYSAR